jgi:drug/metabolite transporter (DMT)-like permease
MNVLLPVIFAGIAAIGNAMFALGQRNSAGAENGLVFVGLSASVAVILSFVIAPLMGSFAPFGAMKGNWKYIALSGTGLFLTYVGFNLLYTRYGASEYVLYAVLSIITTTIIVGILWLKEPVNIFHIMAIVLAVGAVILFSIGNSKA